MAQVQEVTKASEFAVQDVSDVDIAFPAEVYHLMPREKDIPRDYPDQRKWTQFQRDWFFGGLKDLKLVPKEGINQDKAMRHLKCIQGSFAPSHEHKEAAVAWLASLWFTDATWDTNGH